MAKKLLVSILMLSLTGEFFNWLPTEASGPTVLISEVCTDPQSDWSTNEFSGVPGVEAITSSDEFIEIVNVSDQSIDLTSWTIRIEDSAVDIDEIDASLVKNEENEGDITQFPVGHYYVLGNPVGSLNNDVRVELIDNNNQVVDVVSLGDFADGDPEDNAVDGNASSEQDEVLARNYNNQDTDVDKADWQKNQQSMGQQNLEWEEIEEEPEPETDQPEEAEENPPD
ncbi:lamin tail domain-containing protein, partial [Patescibacteria group bacterium]|nr:lamin tail domain-containing protein [Patescibacteria group bacterium]